MVDGPLGRLPETATCPRCGLTRKVRPERGPGLCVSCASTPIPEPTHREALPPGRWVRRGHVLVFEPMKLCHCGAPLVGPSCDTCLAWAERAAERHLWERQRRETRGRIWDILDARKSVAA